MSLQNNIYLKLDPKYALQDVINLGYCHQLEQRLLVLQQLALFNQTQFEEDSAQTSNTLVIAENTQQTTVFTEK